ncbi:acyl-CoA desaturase, partial [Acinetobacter variabilis]
KEIQVKKAAVAERIHQMDDKLKMEFQLVEQRLSHHRETLNLLVRNLKKTPVSE